MKPKPLPTPPRPRPVKAASPDNSTRLRKGVRK